MIEAVKLVWHKIPKRAIIYILGLFAAVIADRTYDVITADANFIGWPKFLSLAIWTLSIIAGYFLLAFLYLSIHTISDFLKKSIPSEAFTHNPRGEVPAKKALPYSKVAIGVFGNEKLSVDIEADIVLDEDASPDVGNFLERIRLGDPFCPTCSRPLDDWKLDWKADYAQIGYKCPTCGTESKGDSGDLLNDVHALVRKNYNSYWPLYHDKIMRLTNNRPQDYKLD
jgi:hypothetical protein